jgi:transposase
MVRALSIDLRERVLAAVIEGAMSARGAAARFGISESSAIKWVRRHRQTGTVAPAQIGGHKPRRTHPVRAAATSVVFHEL